MTALLFAVLLALTPASGVGADALPHKLHITYGNAAIEGNVLAVRIRFFEDDLEAAIARHLDRPGFELSVSPEGDAAFLEYFQNHFSIEVDGERLTGRILGSGEDSLDREPVWWYAVQFDAPSPIEEFTATNTLLLEAFADQRNIVKFVLFPNETQKTYSFARGEESFDVSF